jgi:hypothetical protein
MSPPWITITELDSDTLCHMDLEQADAAVEAADKAFTEAQTAADAAKELLFDACAEAVKAGRTADQLEAKLKSTKTPEQIKAGLAFTGAYIRRKVRERGVERLRSGPKPRAEIGGE